MEFFITMFAMFKYPEVFKCGAALRSVTDFLGRVHGRTRHEDERSDLKETRWTGFTCGGAASTGRLTERAIEKLVASVCDMRYCFLSPTIAARIRHTSVGCRCFFSPAPCSLL